MLDKTKRYLVVGLGLLGGKYALELTRAGFHVDGINRSEGHLQYALSHGYIASGSIRFDGTPEEVFSNPKELSDIGLSVPAPTQIAAALREQGARIEGSIYTIEQLLAALLKLKKEAGRNA